MPLDIETLQQLQDWMDPRFGKIENVLDRLQVEVRDRDHATKGSTETIARQMVEVVKELGYLRDRVVETGQWREEGGVLDNRLKASESRHTAQERISNRMIGALILLGALFPVTVAATVAIVLQA